ncbi:hypothetical protein [uncultured Fibrella sp.]|uniref:hypothetical protein n=1 Tax=uncultured Fibrella sp. TaxID=1284596 RepID=UPI0035C9B6C2
MPVNLYCPRCQSMELALRQIAPTQGRATSRLRGQWANPTNDTIDIRCMACEYVWSPLPLPDVFIQPPLTQAVSAG